MILDFSVVPSAVTMDATIATAASIVHQSENNCALLLYPVPYSGLSMPSLLASQRRIEDKLLFHKMSIEARIPHAHSPAFCGPAKQRTPHEHGVDFP